MRTRASVPVLAFVGAAIVAAAWTVTGAAAKAPRIIDQVWAHPDFAAFHVQSIAMAPAATFDHDIETEKLVQSEWGRSFQGAGYRWVSAGSVRDLIRAGVAGDSILKVIKDAVLERGRIDSLMASDLCARFRTRALLSVRVDQLTQVAIEPGQSGKPSTSISVRAALVDSTGQLLWRISGSETVEGIYQESSASDAEHSGSAGTRSTGLRGSTSAGAPPALVDVLDRLFMRWSKLFPAKAAPADSSK